VLEERQPGGGDETQRHKDAGTQERTSAAAPAQPGGVQTAGTAAEILRNGGQLRRSRAATRAGLTAAAILAVAIAAAVAGLSLLANIGSNHGQLPADEWPPSGPPLRVVSVLPTDKSSDVNGATNVEIALSARLATKSVVPSFNPAVAGRWQVSGSLLNFTPSAGFAPFTQYTLQIPAGRTGLRSATGGAVRKPMLVSFRTGGYSQLRLGEVLSQLGYLPMSWQPSGPDPTPAGPAAGGIDGQELMAYSPPTGSFTWYDGYPASLRALWVPGQPNVVLRGAVMAFEAQHNLAVNAQLTSKFWDKLFAAVVSSDRNSLGYTYAIASKGSPETLTIWHNGRQVLRSLANTGIPIDPTVSGTFPVYQRYRFQIMSGTNPGGSSYADPVSFVSYFNGGDAVHYFPRGYYGAPQSLGCVELPYNDAEEAWPYLTYGSLVTVTG
jgi:lipoprotein-anchoring transpeptidase ErfK/SrfK